MAEANAPRPERAGCRLLELPRIANPRGNLTFVEGNRTIPFAIRKAYWIYDVPGGAELGGCAHPALEEVIVAISGSFDVVTDDGRERQIFSLNRSYYGLYVPPLVWREVRNFSTNALCMILSSRADTEGDRIGDYRAFLAARDHD